MTVNATWHIATQFILYINLSHLDYSGFPCYSPRCNFFSERQVSLLASGAHNASKACNLRTRELELFSQCLPRRERERQKSEESNLPAD